METQSTLVRPLVGTVAGPCFFFENDLEYAQFPQLVEDPVCLVALLSFKGGTHVCTDRSGFNS